MSKESKQNSLKSAYSKLVKKGTIKEDKQQLEVIKTFQSTADAIGEYRSGKGAGFALKKLFGKTEPAPDGIYIWGGVGRGKSMLMDLFYENLKVKRKKRVHFHAFMLDVHQRVYEWREKNDGDPVPDVAGAIAKEAWVLCFDELQVTDIGDAMILGRLFEQLFEYGVVVICTSNRPPDDLYKDGLQRDRFIPFIDVFKEKLKVLELDSKKDYRLEHFKGLQSVYLKEKGKKAEKFLKDTFTELTNGAKLEKREIKTFGRKITLKKTHGDVAWCDFTELCEEALGAADYGQIASEFNTLLLGNIPVLSKEKRNEAKRFVTLIDELYEHKVKLICTAEAEPKKLYKKGDGSFEFERTASRLIEMQSDKYLKLAHIT